MDGMASVLGGGRRMQSHGSGRTVGVRTRGQRLPQLLKRGNGCRTEEVWRGEWFYMLVAYSLRYRETGQGRAGQGRPTYHMMYRFCRTRGQSDIGLGRLQYESKQDWNITIIITSNISRPSHIVVCIGHTKTQQPSDRLLYYLFPSFFPSANSRPACHRSIPQTAPSFGGYSTAEDDRGRAHNNPIQPQTKGTAG